MATEIIMRIVPGGAMAVNAIEADKLEPLHNQELMCKISKPRNLKFHKLYFALLGVARDMADTDMNSEQFRAYVTAGAGWCDFIEGDSGMIAVPKSISFSAMDETEFKRLYNDSATFICQKFVIDREQLDRILDFL